MSSAGSVCWTKRGANPGRKPAHRRQVGPVGPVGPSWPKILTNSRGTFVFFFCVFFFPWVFGAVWKFLATEIQHPRKNANSLKLKKYFLQICGWTLLVVLPFFFLNLFPGVDLDERNFPPVIRKGSLKRHQFFLTLWQIWIKKYSNSIT